MEMARRASPAEALSGRGGSAAKMTISLLAIAVLVGACESQITHPGPPHPVTTAPSSLVISLADLPQGWSVDTKVTRSITSTKGMLGDTSDDSAYRDNGWSSAYEADFTYGGDDSRRVAILVDEFNDPAGARSFFTGGIGGQKGQHGQELVHPPALGQDSYDYTQHLAGKGTQFWFYWIDRNIFVRVLIGGPDGSITEARATDVAQRVARIISSTKVEDRAGQNDSR